MKTRTYLLALIGFVYVTLAQSAHLATAEPLTEVEVGAVLGRATEAQRTAYLCLNMLAALETVEEDDHCVDLDAETRLDLSGARDSLESHLMTTVWFIHRGVTLKGRPEVKNTVHAEKTLQRIARYFFNKHPDEMEGAMKCKEPLTKKDGSDGTKVERGIHAVMEQTRKNILILAEYRGATAGPKKNR